MCFSTSRRFRARSASLFPLSLRGVARLACETRYPRLPSLSRGLPYRFLIN